MKLKQPNIIKIHKCNKCGNDVEFNINTFDDRSTFIYFRALKVGITCDDCRRGKQWTRETYAAYLKSYHWQTKRTAALKRAGDKCQVCASVNRLEVHHNDYSDLGGEPLTDLVVLCHDCHTLFHGAEL